MKGFPGGSEVKASACNAGDLSSTPGSGRSPGEVNGKPLQYSCLKNPMDGGAWWAIVHGVAKSQTRLSNFTFTMKLTSYPQSLKTEFFGESWLLFSFRVSSKIISMNNIFYHFSYFQMYGYIWLAEPKFHMHICLQEMLITQNLILFTEGLTTWKLF